MARKFQESPHNLYTNSKKIEEAIKRKGLDEKGESKDRAIYTYVRERIKPAGNPINHIEVVFLLKNYKVSYQYDPQSSLYRRWMNGTAHVDLNNNRQLAASNVVIIGAEHRVLDHEGRLDVALMGKGPGLLFQQGIVKKVEWRHDKETSAIALFDEQGEVPFVPGKIHFLVVPLKPAFADHVTYS